MILFAALALSTQAAAAPQRLTLDDYLSQVTQQSPAAAAARLRSEGGRGHAEAAGVLTFPYLFGSASAYDDQTPTAIPAFQGTGTKGNSTSLGLGVNTPYGLAAKYTWNTANSEVIGAAFPTTGNFTSYNKLDLTMNLIRNGFGSELGARKELIRSGATAASLTGEYQYVGTLAQAEGIYWKLALARETVLVQKEVLSRAEKLLTWARRRVGLQLGDRSDVLQAQSSYDLHNIDLSSAVEDEKTSGHAFNVLRNRDGDSVPEAVGFPSVEETLKMAAPSREGERLDVQAAAERAKAAQAQTQLDKEALKPNVDVVASYAWNARKPLRSDAISEGFKGNHPTKSIAVTFSMPLDVPTWKNALRGADQEIEAANFEVDQARLTEARDWNDLVRHLAEARSRLKLLATVEGVQRDKFENERQRLLRGRTTTYQALTFEQDYASTQLLRLRTQADILQTLAQMRTFRGNAQ